MTTRGKTARAVTVVVLVLLLGGGALVTAASATFPGNNGLLAQACPDGGICVLNPDGGDLRHLTDHPDDAEPSWSADGTKIVFMRRGEGADVPIYGTLYVIDADGENLRSLGVVGADPSWSPDGTEVAYWAPAPSSVDPNKHEVFKIAATGGNPVQLTDETNFESQWGPTDRIAYVGFGGFEECPGGVTWGVHDIWVMDDDGGGKTPWITSPDYDETRPSWSPDGAMITALRDRDGTMCNNQGGSEGVLYASDGTTDNWVIDPDVGFCQDSAVWSPDGTKIRFFGYDCDGSDPSVNGVYEIPAPEPGDPPLTTGWQPVEGFAFSWQPCFDVCPDESTSTSTSTTVRVTKTSEKVKVSGTVDPPRPGDQVSVKFFKKKDGRFVKIDTKRPTLTAESRYSTAFRRPRAKTCKVVSRYAGDADHLASKDSITFGC